MNTVEFNRLLRMCRDAMRGGWSAQSAGEKLAAALVLNRADWLKQMDCTIPEAIERVGREWISIIPTVARTLRNEVQAESDIDPLESLQGTILRYEEPMGPAVADDEWEALK
ncbi:MAG: hypothetical protein LBE59_07855 [Nevskiaceae bacterium]|jgi:hypothetical protein|nr:hypothetical protein [Nevskiaceae bacterium]